ncbi:F-box only protein 28 isoform X2 [Lethenteron reissneri]|uniref:F-box only protein 28 isoform X2 n=1 Tax=Lethenteron reissneri TaxID=7753 RepID=UPI002AB7AB9B|nr:F-box only protein 28 isoform X2 [Lethenteron reissneri]
MEAESELLSLPSVAMDAVLAFCSYDEISGLRLVCKKMNVICQRVLNQGFLRVERYHAQCQKQVKSQLPRRESERRSHPLARHADILAAVETRLSLLTMTFMKYVDMNLCCFIPGRVIDEIYRVLRYVNGTRTPQRAHEVLQELRDISSMAMEYFDEKIVPGLKKKIGGDMSTRFLSATSGPSGALATVQLFSKQSCAKQELNKMQTQLKANSAGLGGLRKELNDLRGKLGELQRQVQEQEQKLLEQSQVMVEQSTRLLEQERKLGQTEAKLAEQHSVQLALPPPPPPPPLQPSKDGGAAPSTSAAADAGDVALAAGVGGRAAGQSAHRRGGRGRGRGGGRGGGGGGGVDRGDGSQLAPPAADRSRSHPGAVAAQGGSAGGSGGRGGSSSSHRKRCLAREAASSSATASIGGDGGCDAANCAAATTTVPVAAGSPCPSATGHALPKRRKMLHGDEEAVGGAAARRTTRKAHGTTAAVDSNSSKRQRAKK